MKAKIVLTLNATYEKGEKITKELAKKANWAADFLGEQQVEVKIARVEMDKV